MDMELGYLIHNLEIDGKVVLRWLNTEEDTAEDVEYLDTHQIPREVLRCANVIRLYAIHPISGEVATCIEVEEV